MDFFDLPEVIAIFKAGNIDSFLTDLDLNDLALISHEMEGFAQKHNRHSDLKPLLITINNIIDERRAAMTN